MENGVSTSDSASIFANQEHPLETKRILSSNVCAAHSLFTNINLVYTPLAIGAFDEQVAFTTPKPSFWVAEGAQARRGPVP